MIKKKKQAKNIPTIDNTATSLQTSHLPTHALSWIPCELWWVCVGATDGIQHEPSLQLPFGAQHTLRWHYFGTDNTVYWVTFYRRVHIVGDRSSL